MTEPFRAGIKQTPGREKKKHAETSRVPLEQAHGGERWASESETQTQQGMDNWAHAIMDYSRLFQMNPITRNMVNTAKCGKRELHSLESNTEYKFGLKNVPDTPLLRCTIYKWRTTKAEIPHRCRSTPVKGMHPSAHMAQDPRCKGSRKRTSIPRGISWRKTRHV